MHIKCQLLSFSLINEQTNDVRQGKKAPLITVLKVIKKEIIMLLIRDAPARNYFHGKV